MAYLPTLTTRNFGIRKMPFRLRPLPVSACLFMITAMTISMCAQAKAVKSIHVSDDPGVKSGSALVLDEQTSEVLYAREPDIAVPIASISKLMTTLVVLE